MRQTTARACQERRRTDPAQVRLGAEAVVQTSPTHLPTRPNAPYPKSQSLSRSFESILPTSLIYIVLSTRGCSPWRPAAVMGTTGRENLHHLPLDFQGPSSAPDTTKMRCSSSRKTLLRLTRFRGRSRAVKEKRELFPGPTAGVSRVHLTLPFESTFRCRNINRLPFR